MKLTLKSSLIALLLVNGSTYALNPVQEWYGGIVLGGSITNKINFTLINPLDSLKYSGQLQYSGAGDIAGQIGYRMEQFRVETELFFNYSPYHQLLLNGLKVTTPHKSPATAYGGLQFKGRTETGAILVNGIYDAYSIFEQSNYVPYIGVGIGYAYVENNINFYYNNHTIAGTKFTENNQAFAGQAMIGISYFMDDFTTFSLDYRYFSTANIPIRATVINPAYNYKITVNTFNLTFNGAFDCG